MELHITHCPREAHDVIGLDSEKHPLNILYCIVPIPKVGQWREYSFRKKKTKVEMVNALLSKSSRFLFIHLSDFNSFTFYFMFSIPDY